MKLAIMQPYFFPYLGYFDLLNSVDLFVVYDTVQYIHRGWIHRNRVLHQSGIGWQYIIVPTEKVHQKTPILEVPVLSGLAWKDRILNQLVHYKHAAPYAEQTLRFVDECLAVDETLISKLDVYILSRCADLLNLDFHYQFCSKLDIKLDLEKDAEGRILDLCESLGADEYVNLPGGVELYHPDIFESRNIKLTFRKLPTFVYPTGSYAFEPNLSIIDLLMWNEPKIIKKYLDQYRN